MILFCLIFVLCFLYAVYKYIRKQQKSKQFPQPPSYPGHLPIIGHAYMFIGDSIQIWKSLQKLGEECLRRDGAITVSLGTNTFYVISDPDDCFTIGTNCLEKDHRYHLFKPWLGDGLITSSLDIWKKHRKLLNPAFNQIILDEFLKVFNSQSTALVNGMSSKLDLGRFDHFSYFEKMTLETVCLTAIGIPGEEITTWIDQYMNAAAQLARIQMHKLVKIWLQVPLLFYMSGIKQKEQNLIASIHDLMDLIIKTKKDIMSEVKNRDSGKKFKAFLDLMLECSEKADAFTNQEIKEEVDTIILAGYQSIASTLTIMLVLLGSHKDVQNRVHQELEEVFGNSERNVDRLDFSKLTYLDAVIKETLRLYSVTPVISRHLEKDIQLKNYTLLAGRSCALMIYGLHRHQTWGSDVTDFKPERWLETNKLSDTNKIFTPFSFGRRDCIGKTYAMMLMKTAIVHVLRRFKIDSELLKLELQINIILRPSTGHYISIYDRKKESVSKLSKTI